MTSYAARLNYGYKGRYLLTATIRRDGSSKFTKDNRWGTFPSAAAAWRISEEPFMQNVNWLSNLKLRLSYGVTGNNTGIGSYDTQQTLSSPISYPFGPTYSTGYTASKIVNKDLKWETSTEYNAGIDFGFFGGRINGSVDVYQKTSKDLLAEVMLPLVSGGGTMITNIGSVRNTGVEIALTTINIENKDWHWETTFTFAHNKNKVREINGTGDQVLNGTSVTGNYFIGYSANNVYAYDWGGVVTDRDMIVPDNAAAKNAGLTPGSTMKEYDYFYQVYGLTEGQPWIVDQNGDGSIDPNDRVIKSMDPKWTGSFTSNLSWKNWDFSFSLYAKVGYKVYSSFLTSNINDLADRGRQKLNMDWYIPAGTLIDCDGVNEDGTYINPVYQETTHYGDYPFPNNGGGSSGVGRQSGEWNQAKGVVNASFMKVKNITLGYTFDKNFLNKFGCKHLRLYATVTNPFVATSYKGFDPEWASAGVKQDGPSIINYQIGASIKF
jgi:TonB-linked SusC/RagA family outer membrane protein